MVDDNEAKRVNRHILGFALSLVLVLLLSFLGGIAVHAERGGFALPLTLGALGSLICVTYFAGELISDSARLGGDDNGLG